MILKAGEGFGFTVYGSSPVQIGRFHEGEIQQSTYLLSYLPTSLLAYFLTYLLKFNALTTPTSWRV